MDKEEDKKIENHKKTLDPHDKILRKKEENIFEMANGRYMVIVQKRIGGKVNSRHFFISTHSQRNERKP